LDTITKRPIATTSPRRVDFELAAYMASDDRIALWQIISTVLPIIAISVGLGIATQSLTAQTFVLSAVLFVLLVLFLSRSFSLMHDCGHQSLFRSKSANRIAAFLLSLIHGMPHYPWSRGHAFHHKHNGNWDRYRGPSALITSQEFDRKTNSSKRLYEVLRHPLLLFPGGFFYLIIKPRVALLLGFFEFILHSLRACLKDTAAGKLPDLGQIALNHKSSFFYTKGEAIDTAANTVCVALIWWWAGSSIGYLHFWILYFLVMSTSAALMIAVFFIQHNYPGSYASNEEDWSYFKGALEGSSFLQMPAILNWFTADIAYHHIHHLSERIPNYRLSQCHQANIHLLGGVRRLYLSEISTCFSLILWDREKLELTTTTAA
jgi:omega-6 fatty acid desaturase (delta-12 desaturase)